MLEQNSEMVLEVNRPVENFRFLGKIGHQWPIARMFGEVNPENGLSLGLG